MKKYAIAYVDGFDLRFKIYVTNAENEDDAVDALYKAHSDGDFDHQIIEIKDITNQDIKEMKP